MDIILEKMEIIAYYISMGQDGGWEDFLHYIPYSEEDEKLGMVCTTVGRTEISPRTVYPPNKSDHPVPFRSVAEGRTLAEFQIVYITKGQGAFTSAAGFVDSTGNSENTGNAKGETSYTVKEGSLFLILPGLKHKYKPDFETGWIENWIGFNGEYFMRLLREGILSLDHVFFEIGLYDSILTVFNTVFDEVRAQRPLFQFKSCSAILTLIAEMLSFERRREQPGYYHSVVEKAKYLMESNVYGVINLSDISTQIGISTSRFIEIFKTYTSMTPYQYYMHIKIHMAENLLERNNLSIAEVAHHMGFEDEFYFSRLFKNKTGVSPSKWKKMATDIGQGIRENQP
jgi:AraC-like DNA-binding protein